MIKDGSSDLAISDQGKFLKCTENGGTPTDANSGQNANSTSFIASSIQDNRNPDSSLKTFLGNLAAGAVAGCVAEAGL